MDLTPVLKLNLPAFAFEPWDDEVNDNFDVLDAFVGSVVGVANYAGVWENNTPYTVGQSVIDTSDSSFWACNVSHLSATDPVSFLTDRANHPTYWSLKQNSAKQYAEEAANSAADAAASAAAAEAAYNAVMPDAPRDGTMYGRIDGTWRQAVAIDSPFFIGDPRAPTPPLSDNDNSIATTAFVKGLVGTTAAFVNIGDTPPPSPSIGSLWWDDIGGQLYVYYHDANSYQWVAVNSATGGQGTGFMPVVGGTFTGPVLLSRDPLSAMEAATQQYVQQVVNTKSYPYLPLSGGTVSGALTVTGAAQFNSTLNATGALSATGAMSTGSTLTAAAMIRSNNGRIMNYAPNYAPSVTLWRADIGARGMWSNGNDVVLGVLDGAGTPIAGWGGWNSSADFYTVGAIWATNRTGAFGLQDFSGGYWGLRFSADGWRLQWNSAAGHLAFTNPAGTWLWSTDPSGNMNANGQIVAGTAMYANTGVHFGSQNGWEYQAYVDGAGNQIFNHRGGYYEWWATSGGDSHWIKNNAEVMSISSAGDLWALRNISSNGGMFSGYIRSYGNVQADGTHTGGAVSVSGDVYGSAHYGPNGIFVGGSGDTSFGFYNSGGTRIWQMNPNKYWGCNAGNGDLAYNIDGLQLLGITRYGVVAGRNLVVYNGNFAGGFAAYAYLSLSSLFARTSVRAAPRGLAEIMNLGVGMRDEPASDSVPARSVITFVTDDLAEQLPEVTQLHDDDAGKHHSTDIMGLMAVMVNAIKELGARVIALEARSGA